MKDCSLPYRNILEQNDQYANNNDNIHAIFTKKKEV